MVLTTQAEYIPAEDKSLVPGFAEVVNGWKFTAVGLPIVAHEPSMCGLFIAKNLIVDHETRVKKVIGVVLYEFYEPLEPTNDERAQVDGLRIDDDETLYNHIAIFRAARIALGDRTVG